MGARNFRTCPICWTRPAKYPDPLILGGYVCQRCSFRRQQFKVVYDAYSRGGANLVCVDNEQHVPWKGDPLAIAIAQVGGKRHDWQADEGQEGSSERR